VGIDECGDEGGDAKTVQTQSGLLSWSHFIEIIYLKDPLQRQFYAEMARVERWSVRTLRQKVQGLLYERNAISRETEELARQELEALQKVDRMTPDLVFRDPYLLDFLRLADTYSERDLEVAILKELERFLLELGTDISFIACQNMTIGERDFYLDLLFYHRSLHRMVAIELKLGSFDAAYKGQMELYLRWLDRDERRSGEDMPIGLILCGEENREQTELLQLDWGEIRVAEYLMELPPRKIFASLGEGIGTYWHIVGQNIFRHHLVSSYANISRLNCLCRSLAFVMLCLLWLFRMFLRWSTGLRLHLLLFKPLPSIWSHSSPSRSFLPKMRSKISRCNVMCLVPLRRAA
jgi:predicted nuclease of restriction endonuclease-like (RecB) superfamily